MNSADQIDSISPTRLCSSSHVVVVGGGTAGWMAATTLRRRIGCRVTLIEARDVPPIGVGEATIPAMVDWLSNMGIDETDFLRETSGTYKLAIRFDDWTTLNHRYWHPFGVCGATVDGIDLAHIWRRGTVEGWLAPSTEYTDFSLQRMLCERHRSPRMHGQESSVANYAFHMDAGKLAAYLKRLAIRMGVQHCVGKVVATVCNHSGDIDHLKVDGQSDLTGDWFIDCTGFASELIGRTMKSPWIDWSDQLLCDRAVTLRVPNHADEDVPPYTVSTGLSAGWSWEIPLQDQTGAGYVYSSQHLSDDEARAELLEHLDVSDWVGDCRFISMKIGMRPEPWRANCVAIGLSAGFIEPLESTGIFLIQRALDEWVDACQSDHTPVKQRDRFNQRMSKTTEEIRDFVLLHYVLSQRTDTAFWRDARSVESPVSLVQLLNQYRHSGTTPDHDHDPVFFDANHHFIHIGNGSLPPTRDSTPNSDLKCFRVTQMYAPEQLSRILLHIHHENLRCASMLPSHRSWLSTISSAPVPT